MRERMTNPKSLKHFFYSTILDRLQIDNCMCVILAYIYINTSWLLEHFYKCSDFYNQLSHNNMIGSAVKFSWINCIHMGDELVFFLEKLYLMCIIILDIIPCVIKLMMTMSSISKRREIFTWCDLYEWYARKRELLIGLFREEKRSQPIKYNLLCRVSTLTTSTLS